MKQLAYVACIFLVLLSCKKGTDNINLDPIFYPTDMLFENLEVGRFKHIIPTADFTSEIATFKVNRTGSDWSGFAMSSRNLRTFVQTAASVDSTIFSAYTIAPNAGGNFLVVRPKGDDAQITFSRPIQIEKFLITNTTQVYQSIMGGEGSLVSGKPNFTYATGTRTLTITKKDYVKVIIKGFNGEVATGEVTFFLADRNSDDNLKKNFTVTDWLPVSLDALGKVTRIIFYMDSSDKTNGIMNTPAYFCIDGFRFRENIK